MQPCLHCSSSCRRLDKNNPLVQYPVLFRAALQWRTLLSVVHRKPLSSIRCRSFSICSPEIDKRVYPMCIPCEHVTEPIASLSALSSSSTCVILVVTTDASNVMSASPTVTDVWDDRIQEENIALAGEPTTRLRGTCKTKDGNSYFFKDWVGMNMETVRGRDHALNFRAAVYSKFHLKTKKQLLDWNTGMRNKRYEY